ncbi:ATP/GTP-binding protein [Streptomyces sp. AJS327]|uniref:ATP/GTP-binding protein n=1 Tax=Streptomyces sp. AJS327 TaxID=2545265 RepID=UPI0015DF4DD7|nr:ATP/GTP-binding protein [Streptomyces sp. AJS327]MBA0051612.1 ATP/GTP-binding protein [Streptomyces sp. AJS327]
MSPRRNRPRGGADRPRPGPETSSALETTATWRGEEWVLRQVSGHTATKRYRCPGCDQEIPPGVPHVVAWPVGEADDRRHWHRACWNARDNRSPRTQRPRDAPRY